jgi:hypothetical protein
MDGFFDNDVEIDWSLVRTGDASDHSYRMPPKRLTTQPEPRIPDIDGRGLITEEEVRAASKQSK